MKKTARLAVSIALISFVLFSCAKKETVRPEAWSPATPSELIDRITYDNIDTLSGTASIRIFNDGEYAAYLTGAVNYKRPASLSMSVFGPFGITVMKILLAEGVFEIYIPNKDTLYTARLNIHFLLPTKKQLRSYRADVAERADDYMLNIYPPPNNSSSPDSIYYFNKRTLKNYRIEKYNDGKLIFAIDIEETDNENLPTEFSVTAGKSRFEINADNLSINTELPSAAFKHMEASRTLPLQEFLSALAPNR